MSELPGHHGFLLMPSSYHRLFITMPLHFLTIHQKILNYIMKKVG